MIDVQRRCDVHGNRHVALLESLWVVAGRDAAARMTDEGDVRMNLVYNNISFRLLGSKH